MTFVLGLTGGIATGKSTAARFFIEQGVPVVDADIIARQVVAPGAKGLALLVTSFGSTILQEDGHLDRKKLGKLVFGNQTELTKLNQLLAEELATAISREITAWCEKGVPLLVVDIPLLYEAGYEEKMDQVMVVYVPESCQYERLQARDQLTRQEATQRINSQLGIEAKKVRADIVIDNSGALTETIKQLATWLTDHLGH